MIAANPVQEARRLLERLDEAFERLERAPDRFGKVALAIR